MTCEKCGQELRVGDFPFCPHGGTGRMIVRDEIPGGVTLENYGPQPITFYSHSERRRYMKEHGLTERETFAPLPGTDVDPQGIPNPKGYVDQQTLANATELMLRSAKVPENEIDIAVSFFNRDVDEEEGTDEDRETLKELGFEFEEFDEMDEDGIDLDEEWGEL